MSTFNRRPVKECEPYGTSISHPENLSLAPLFLTSSSQLSSSATSHASPQCAISHLGTAVLPQNETHIPFTEEIFVNYASGAPFPPDPHADTTPHDLRIPSRRSGAHICVGPPWICHCIAQQYWAVSGLGKREGFLWLFSGSEWVSRPLAC